MTEIIEGMEGQREMIYIYRDNRQGNGKRIFGHIWVVDEHREL